MATAKATPDFHKFVDDLIDEVEKDESIDPIAFNTALISALIKQLPGPGAGELKSYLSRGQKAARTRKRNAAKAAKAGQPQAA